MVYNIMNTESTNTANNTLISDAANLASDKWKDAFNTGDAAACAEADVVMQARPMGTITGTAEI